MRAALLLLTGCAASPMGIGTGARSPAKAAPDWSTSAGVGRANNREIVQLDGSLAHRFGPVFSLEYGAAITTVAIAHRPSIPAPPMAARSSMTTSTVTGTLLSIGILPYVRPRWQLGPLSIALAGMVGMGGTEEGAIGAFGDAQVGLGGARWSIYAGANGLAYIDSFGTYVRAVQTRLGAELFAGHIGIAIEAFTGLDAIQLEQEARPTTLRFTGAGIKLRVER